MKRQAYALLAALVLGIAPAFGQGWNIELIDMIYDNQHIWDVALQGNAYAFLADWDDGFRVVDISNPAHLLEVASLGGMGEALSVFAYGDYAFLECSEDVNWVIDVSNPLNPVAVGSFPLDGHICVVESEIAYAAATYEGVQILDISNPANPILLGSYDPQATFVNDMDKEGEYLYVPCCWGSHSDWIADSLLVLDVSDPANPVRVGMTGMYGEVHDAEVVGSYAFFTATVNHFQCWDVSDPHHPNQIGVLNFTYGLWDLAVQGDFAFATRIWPVGLRIVDVRDPAHPAESGNYDTPGVSMGVAVFGDYTFVADGNYFESYNSSAATPADLELSLIPLMMPIQIPSSGGSFDFYIFIDNHEPEVQLVDVWTKVILPGGSTISPMLGPVSVSLDSGTTGWIRHQNVPERAPAGLYTYFACAGDYPSSLWASDSLQFTKLASGDSGPGPGDWSNTGESLEIANDEFLTHHSSFVISARPNPFNPTTAISFELPEASFVKLSVYGISGRLVATLVEGWKDAGRHEVTFDGSGLASGIYLYRVTAGSWSETAKMILLK